MPPQIATVVRVILVRHPGADRDLVHPAAAGRGGCPHPLSLGIARRSILCRPTLLLLPPSVRAANMPTINFTNATGSITYEEGNVPPPNPTPPTRVKAGSPPPISAPTPAPKPPRTCRSPAISPSSSTRSSAPRSSASAAIPAPRSKDSAAKWGDVNRHHYNSDQAWNCNQTLIYLSSPGVFIDGETYEPKFMASGTPSATATCAGTRQTRR